MTRNLVKLLALLVLGSTVQPACAPPTRPTAAAPGARASSPEVVHVAPPTGEREIDRSSILAALERIQPGGTVQFAPGTYLVGEIIRVEVPRITILGHPDGTTLRGCDPAEFVEAEVAMVACNGFELTGGHQAVRDLTFEYTWDALWVGCCQNPTAPGEGGQPSHVGGQLIEGNTFRSSMNGIRVIGDSPEPAVIRNNDFINVWHAAVVNGRTAHILDNRVSAPEPARIPITGLPGLAIGVTAFDTRLEQAFTCTHNVIAGNRVEGHPEGIAILAFRSGGSCRENVIRRNRIVPSRVRFGSPSWGVIGLRDEADSSIAGVPLALAELVTEMSEYFGLPEEPGEEALIEDNLIEGNQILGAEGLGIEVLRASRNRIVNNSITGVVRRDPFPGNTLGFAPEWGDANGTGIWISPGSEENEIVGNTFEDIASYAVVLEGDGNRVETQSASDAVRDLGSGNRVRAPRVVGDPAALSGRAAGRRPAHESYAPAADGVRLFYRFEGQGSDTVIVLHGGPSLGFAYLAPDLEPLGREYTLLYYDQRGIGRSTPLAEGAELTITRHVEDLEALRRHFGLGRLALVGHSWGGMLAARYAAAYPEYVERMLFIDPMVPARSPYMAQAGARAQQFMRERLDSLQLARLDSLGRSWAEAEDPVSHCRTTFGILVRLYFQAPDGAERARGDFCTHSAEVLRSRPQVDAAIMGSLEDWDVRPLLTAVTVPVLIVHGSTSAIPPEAMQAWAHAFPNARLLVVPDAGHYLHVDRPDVFFPAAVGFLGGRWPAGATVAVPSPPTRTVGQGKIYGADSSGGSSSPCRVGFPRPARLRTSWAPARSPRSRK